MRLDYVFRIHWHDIRTYILTFFKWVYGVDKYIVLLLWSWFLLVLKMKETEMSVQLFEAENFSSSASRITRQQSVTKSHSYLLALLLDV